MAEEAMDFEQKTEPASPRRREEAAERGQFGLSLELNTGLILMAAMGALSLATPALGGMLLSQMRVDLAGATPRDFSAERVQHLFFRSIGGALGASSLLFAVVFLGTIAVNVAQVGFRFNTERLAFDFSRIQPDGFGRLLSWNKVVGGLLLMIKVAVVAGVAWWMLRLRGDELAHLGEQSLAGAVARSWELVLRLALGLAGTLLALGFADFLWQRWQFERSIRMSRQELKEEFKREEGDPQIKARLRKLQRDNAQRKMFRQVPSATVVVTNPTHLAVALRYEAGKMAAPRVVAKGAGHVAKRIVRLARRYGVPVLERKPLAQALFKSVKVDREIPMGLYLVVAELLAHVYRLRGGTQGA